MSSELKRRGFRFVGPTICYAFMQAAGMVNDHVARATGGARSDVSADDGSFASRVGR